MTNAPAGQGKPGNKVSETSSNTNTQNTQDTENVTEDNAKGDGPMSGKWKSEAAKAAYKNQNGKDGYTDDTDDEHTPMTVHREPFITPSGEAGTREHRVKTEDYPEFLEALEARRGEGR